MTVLFLVSWIPHSALYENLWIYKNWNDIMFWICFLHSGEPNKFREILLLPLRSSWNRLQPIFFSIEFKCLLLSFVDISISSTSILPFYQDPKTNEQNLPAVEYEILKMMVMEKRMGQKSDTNGEKKERSEDDGQVDGSFSRLLLMAIEVFACLLAFLGAFFFFIEK